MMTANPDVKGWGVLWKFKVYRIYFTTSVLVTSVPTFMTLKNLYKSMLSVSNDDGVYFINNLSVCKVLSMVVCALLSWVGKVSLVMMNIYRVSISWITWVKVRSEKNAD